MVTHRITFIEYPLSTTSFRKKNIIPLRIANVSCLYLNIANLSMKLFFSVYFTSSHCVKNVHIWSFSGPYVPVFRLNTERYFVSVRIQSECGKIRTRKIWIWTLCVTLLWTRSVDNSSQWIGPSCDNALENN